MDYQYETLGDERFQKFCQTLLVAQFPNVQCLPVGQPDGGRDGFERHESGFVVFQVKYSRNPSLKDERETVDSLIQSEEEKVRLLIEKGATSYYLLTNVSGTSHLDSGSIDKVNVRLNERFGIPCYVWWRDDLDRRLEVTKHILWRYPDLARGSDFLEYLASERMNSSIQNSARSFKGYMQAQHTKEKDVKFQQVQIQSRLLDIFTDTPIGQARLKLPTIKSMGMSDKQYQMFCSIMESRTSYLYAEDDRLMAARFFLSQAPSVGLQKIVLEGAPGQGKSTVTQYVCQVHRAVALNKVDDRRRIIPEHTGELLRLPIRVDLRDYALWLTGKDPLSSEKGVARPLIADDALESLIAYQIHRLSGGQSFDVSDLSRVLDGAHCALVLDGFDEVADTATRARLIEQIDLASDRMAIDCASLQVIVTSRPAAFILSSGFSERDWAHLSLRPLQDAQIGSYTEKWIKAKGTDLRTGQDFKSLLFDRIARPHIRSLAQNPMQLAILLNLISTKGMSLPDKRTALYDSYMELFFGRESEKDETVRENRDVLMQIHQHIAWFLQLDAESPGGTGSIAQADLLRLVERFLDEKGHEGDVLKLFRGAVERVGALVSRVQGLLEFEVQPLREYFAGRFLYETAPYSPPGAERRGTKPERFIALARRPYWSNVLRFYAGCYSPGELLSLVAGLEELYDSDDPALKVHALQIAVTLLGDYVFAQEPKTVKKVVEFATRDANLKLLLAYRTAWEDGRLNFPDKCGRSELVTVARSEVLKKPMDKGYLVRLGAILRINSDLPERLGLLSEINWDDTEKLAFMVSLGIFRDAPRELVVQLIARYGPSAILAVLNYGKRDTLEEGQLVQVLNHITELDPKPNFMRMYGNPVSSTEAAIFQILFILNPHVYSMYGFHGSGEATIKDLLQHNGLVRETNETVGLQNLYDQGLGDIVQAAERVCQAPFERWKTDLSLWSDLVEGGRRTWGERALFVALAGVAAGVVTKEAQGEEYGDLFDEKMPLVERVRHARLKASSKWWADNIHRADTPFRRLLVMTVFVAWAPAKLWVAVGSEVRKRVDELDQAEWETLYATARTVIMCTMKTRSPLSGLNDEKFVGFGSERTSAIILNRLAKALRSRVICSLLEQASFADSAIASDILAKAVGAAEEDNRIWEPLISYFESHDGTVMSVGSPFFSENLRYVDEKVSVPQFVSDKVIANPRSYPIRLVEMAELRVLHHVPGSKYTLAQLSADERWFSEQD